MGVVNLIKDWWQRKSACKLDGYFNQLETSMDTLIGKCNKIEKQLETDIKLLTKELEKYKGMLTSISEALPDMMWCKDLNGKYLYANSAIKNGLLFCHDPMGKDDIELSKKAKELFGENEHTFGEKCLNSDKIIIQTGLPQRFLESGKIKGKMMYLEVYKAPLMINGKMVGVVGTGRDMTVYVEAYRNSNYKEANDLFSKYEFEG